MEQYGIVIVGGDTALDEALYLAGTANKVTVIHQTEQPTASAALVARARGNDKIEWISRASITETNPSKICTQPR